TRSTPAVRILSQQRVEASDLRITLPEVIGFALCLFGVLGGPYFVLELGPSACLVSLGATRVVAVVAIASVTVGQTRAAVRTRAVVVVVTRRAVAVPPVEPFARVTGHGSVPGC